MSDRNACATRNLPLRQPARFGKRAAAGLKTVSCANLDNLPLSDRLVVTIQNWSTKNTNDTKQGPQNTQNDTEKRQVEMSLPNSECLSFVQTPANRSRFLVSARNAAHSAAGGFVFGWF